MAEGSMGAAKIIEKEAGRYAMTIKGMEMSGPDPRSGPRGWVFGAITNPSGGDNAKTTHFHAERYNPNWWVDDYYALMRWDKKTGIPTQRSLSDPGLGDIADDLIRLGKLLIP